MTYDKEQIEIFEQSADYLFRSMGAKTTYNPELYVAPPLSQSPRSPRKTSETVAPLAAKEAADDQRDKEIGEKMLGGMVMIMLLCAGPLLVCLYHDPKLSSTGFILGMLFWVKKVGPADALRTLKRIKNPKNFILGINPTTEQAKA